MKKIFVIFLSIITASSGIILGGCSMPSSRSEKEEMIQIAESTKMKKAIEKELRELDPKALTAEGKIKSYEIQKDKLEYNPMGGMLVYVVLNNDHELNMSMTVLEEKTGEYRIASYFASDKLDKLVGGV
ncbi:DUF1310 family protein [Streptococcus sanguinis]|jgi:hypothetical protein|uniref:DUF1310 family protein n=1 Tax=Streptococcus sanguinis TaxID=1305 RepID=A0AB74DN13_STRSA|nr:DUF1310 family protein [Streptococcus sanguinis]EGC27278.1 hypothetical protein HMPREF9392_0864 [Streptococcus sanguinis SK678]MBZ2061719.1 DUF1310 domain-containing protein [Streptococcus sanguinis]MBZ2063972.1 DUF1310 domain-containing protein [Streptococcus sanguinis]RSI30465.1 hypothetical protein D8878_11605 [Streptococcus sanguinis]RSI32982.1 hypothetical protein D8879_02425 [Streptococcus sanguinis]